MFTTMTYQSQFHTQSLKCIMFIDCVYYDAVNFEGSIFKSDQGRHDMIKINHSKILIMLVQGSSMFALHSVSLCLTV